MQHQLTRGGRDYLARARHLVSGARRAGLPHLIASIVFVQGLAYLSQLALAKLLPPAGFGIVRNVEASLSILLTIGVAGMPSLAVRAIASAPDPIVRGRLLGRLLQLALGCGLASSAVLGAVMPRVLPPEARPYFAALVWIIGLSAVNRTCINYFQGVQQFRRMAALNIALSFGALLLLVAMVARAGLWGWVAGRYLGEALFVAGGLFMVRDILRFAGPLPAALSHGRLLALGMPIGLSMIVRTTLDNAGLLALGYWGGSEEAGYYGLSTLLMSAALLVPGGLSSVALPRIVAALTEPGQVWRLFLRNARYCLLVTAPLAMGGILAAPLVIPFLLPQYRPAVAIIQILLIGLPCRALTSLCGTVYLALDRNLETLLLNVATLAVALALLAHGVPRWGATGAAWATVLIEALATSAYLCGVRAAVRARATSGPHAP